MIAVLGDLAAPNGRGVSAESVAARAAVAGSRVEIVGVVPDDDEGDRRMLALAASQVGHAAVLRGPDRALEAEDVDLALRYLPEVRVIVTVGAPRAALGAAREQAGWLGARLVEIAVANGSTEDDAGIEDEAIVIQAPPTDPDGTFAGFVAALAARLDGGATPADAWAATTRELAVDPA